MLRCSPAHPDLAECERLQGFPDGWTQLGDTADSKRYAALGDAVTVNVAEWLGSRLIQHLEARDPVRIPRVLGLLEHYWLRYPDLRLAQIVGNFARTSDPYYTEDDVIERELRAALDSEVMRVEP